MATVDFSTFPDGAPTGFTQMSGSNLWVYSGELRGHSGGVPVTFTSGRTRYDTTDSDNNQVFEIKCRFMLPTDRLELWFCSNSAGTDLNGMQILQDGHCNGVYQGGFDGPSGLWTPPSAGTPVRIKATITGGIAVTLEIDGVTICSGNYGTARSGGYSQLYTDGDVRVLKYSFPTAISASPAGPPELVARTEFASPNTNGGTTGAIDTTGATLLVAHLADGNGTGTISDSKGNTWLTGRAALGASPYSAIYYVENPTVGSGHTFTVTIASGNAPNMQVLAFSGTAIASVKDQSNGTSTGSPLSTMQPGSVTPSEDNELVVTGAAYGDGTVTTPTITGYTITDWQEQANSAHYGGAAAYAVQTTATATNPTWGTGRGFTGSTIVTFKAGSGAAGPPKYTELEWSLNTQSPAVDTEVYEFRVYAGSTPLDTYAVTPQLTMGSTAGAQTTNADPATLTLTGQDVTPTGTGTATTAADVATLSLTGQTPTVSGTGTASTSADVATLTLTGQDVTVAGTGTATAAADPAALTLSGQDVTSTGTGTATTAADVATLTLSGQDVTVSGTGTATVTADPALLALQGIDVGVGGGAVTNADVAALTLTGQDVTVTGTGTATTTADVATLTLTGQDAAASGSGTVTVAADQATLTLTGQTPTMSGTGTTTVTADVATVTLTGQDAAASTPGSAAADPATLTLTGVTPTVSGSGTATRAADPAIITLFGVTPGEQPMVALITCQITGPGLRRIVTGPSNQPVVSVTGPSNQPVASVTGPALARSLTGPAHLTRVATGPGIETLRVTGPDVSRDVTGPAMERSLVLVGPGVCDGD